MNNHIMGLAVLVFSISKGFFFYFLIHYPYYKFMGEKVFHFITTDLSLMSQGYFLQ